MMRKWTLAALALAAVVVVGPSSAPGAGKVVMCQGEAATIVGTASNDELLGTADRDVIAGLAGNDWVAGRGGDDLLCGGSGRDKVDYAAPGAVTVDLQTGSASGADGNDTLSGIEDVVGSDFDDHLTGDDGDNKLYGGISHNGNDGHDGADTLIGLGGNDLLNGHKDANTIDGGTGIDKCRGAGTKSNCER